MIHFTPYILTFLFVGISYAFELTDSTAACIKNEPIYAPQNKFYTEFSIRFVNPKQLNSSINLHELKSKAVVPATAWGECTSACTNRNLISRQAAGSIQNINLKIVGESSVSCNLLYLGPNNLTCLFGVTNLRNLTFLDQSPGLVEVRVLGKTVNPKTEYNVYPVSANGSSLSQNALMFLTYDGNLKTAVYAQESYSRYEYFQFDFGNCQLNFTKIVVEIMENQLRSYIDFSKYQVSIGDSATSSVSAPNTENPLCGGKLDTLPVAKAGIHRATFNCKLQGRFVTIQPYELSYVTIGGGYHTSNLYTQLSIAEVYFFTSEIHND